ncbi:mitochondrial carrier domain-containing protein [Protomyces lactucae-debilis]|uniref:Mitochondrial carrier domain-containing protein n=1 Tax=Protomyces lactucae-debilis TaxID=2754530 RepID=A0A1Y2FTW7_PROLT|nr:mitochondrial carrier domain-containing protein [Protomyces lactucae-debilis]ORY86135.1 mitochondrial carrier domain-containing protein [Protomyces lactucae-debilis]
MTTKFQEQPQTKSISTLGGFISGGLAACIGVTVTNPLEVVKTRLQLQGELVKTPKNRVYTGVFQALGVIYKMEGVRGLQRGLLTAYSYQIALNGCRLGFYEPLRKNITETFYGDPTINVTGINVACGALSGIMGGVIGSPFFLVKTRMQSYSPVFAVGTQHHYKGNIDAFRKIIAESGARGLMKGADAAVLRTGAGSSVQLPIYNASKRFIQKHDLISEGPRMHLAASAVSGFGVCCVMVCSCPL